MPTLLCPILLSLWIRHSPIFHISCLPPWPYQPTIQWRQYCGISRERLVHHRQSANETLPNLQRSWICASLLSNLKSEPEPLLIIRKVFHCRITDTRSSPYPTFSEKASKSQVLEVALWRLPRAETRNSIFPLWMLGQSFHTLSA